MISTRYLAGTIAVSLLSLPFIAPSPATAAPGEVSIGTTAYTGNTETITLVDGDEEGPYKVELWKTAKVATIATGTDITAAGASLKWTIPTTSVNYVGTGFKIKVVSTATSAPFTTLESADFEIAKSAVVIGSQSDITKGASRTINWTRLGQTGGTVDISLVPATGKAVVLADNTENDGSQVVKFDIKTVVATGYKVKVTPSNPAALASESAAVAVVAPDADDMYTSVDDSSLYVGQSTPVYGDTTWGDLQLDLVLKSAPTKSVVKIAKVATYEQMSNDEIVLATTAKLAPGTYQVLSTIVGSKPAITDLSGDIVISGQPAITFTSGTVSALADGVVQGQTMTVDFQSSSPAKSAVTVSLVKGTDKAVVLDAKEVIVSGAGSYTWVVPATQAAAATYKIVVSYNDLKAGATNQKVESSAFTVAANTTVLAS